MKLYLTEQNFLKLQKIVKNTDFATLKEIDRDFLLIECELITDKIDLIIIQLLIHSK